MYNIGNSLVVTFLTLFLTIDVIGVTPIFVSLTYNANIDYKKRVIRQGVLIASLILLLFAISGTSILRLFGIGLPAFRIAGGILLLLLSIDMVLANSSSAIRNETREEHEESLQRNDISVFPLAIPLLSGPATITMLMLFMKQAQGDLTQEFVVLSALAANMLVCLTVLHFSISISKFLGSTGINVIGRIFGIILTAFACQFFIDGISEAFFK